MIDFNKKVITQELIFKNINSYDIFKYYIPDIEINATISSPFRKDDTPSFSIYMSDKYNTLLYKDFATGEVGNAVRFVQRLFSKYSQFDALSQIATDFGITDKYICASVNKSPKAKAIKTFKLFKIKKHVPADLRIKFRTWQHHDLAYWNSYGISLLTLKKFKVLPISDYFLYNRKHEADTYAYAYIEKKDGRMSFKIYQPFANKKNKWRTNHSYSAHQGYLQLPDKNSTLIITKSLKDVMCLDEIVSIPAIGIQCETYIMKSSVMDEYKTRFNNNVVTLFDNDETGINAAHTYKKLFNIPYMIIAKEFYNVKDFSDYVKTVGVTQAHNMIYKQLSKIFPKWTPF